MSEATTPEAESLIEELSGRFLALVKKDKSLEFLTRQHQIVDAYGKSVWSVELGIRHGNLLPFECYHIAPDERTILTPSASWIQELYQHGAEGFIGGSLNRLKKIQRWILSKGYELAEEDRHLHHELTLRNDRVNVYKK